MSTPGSPSQAAHALLAQGRALDALKVTAPEAAKHTADAILLDAHASVLKALERHTEALPFAKRATLRDPKNKVLWHNYASLLGDLTDYAGSRKAADQAFRLGLDAPETWLVHGRALVGLEDFDGGERSFREALKRRPDYADAHRDLAQLIWMRSGDAEAALAPLRAMGGAPQLAPTLAMVLDRVGRPDESYAVLRSAVARAPNDGPLQLALATAASERGDDATAVPLAQRLFQGAGAHPAVVEGVCTVLLGAGRAAEALAVARQRLRADPLDQIALAMAATAARITGDPEYGRLYDYGAFVRPATIATPKGWASLEAYLADLRAALIRMHKLTAHPLVNSLRGGSQTARNLRQDKDPVIAAFFKAIDAPIRAYMAAVGQGDDPLRLRNTGDYALRGAWSVRLRPGGHHVDHIHPQGWLSSAFYVETPAEALDRDSREGWIKFGQPKIRTTPALEPAHYVRPQPGTLVLFPSYMWHGTVPFTTDEARMTIAFDVIPQ